jgi:hypothetical protein
MERSKFTKMLVVSAVSLATGGFLLSSLLGLVDLARSPAPVKNAASSQNAQVAAKENGFLEVLKKEPKNPTALQGMETVVRYYLQTGDKPKTIQALEKLLAAAPEAKNAKEYTKLLTELKNAPSPSPKAK